MEVIKDTFAAKDIKSDSKTFKKSNRSGYLPSTDSLYKGDKGIL